jgi:hypothetical protein
MLKPSEDQGTTERVPVVYSDALLCKSRSPNQLSGLRPETIETPTRPPFVTVFITQLPLYNHLL